MAAGEGRGSILIRLLHSSRASPRIRGSLRSSECLMPRVEATEASVLKIGASAAYFHITDPLVILDYSLESAEQLSDFPV